MVTVNQRFLEAYLFKKLMDCIKSLNEFKDAVDDSEKDLKDRIDGIIKEITGIEI